MTIHDSGDRGLPERFREVGKFTLWQKAHFQAARTLLKGSKYASLLSSPLCERQCSLRTSQREMVQTKDLAVRVIAEWSLIRPCLHSTLIMLNHWTGLRWYIFRWDQASSFLETGNRPAKGHLNYWYSLLLTMSGGLMDGRGGDVQGRFPVGHSQQREGRELDRLQPKLLEDGQRGHNLLYICISVLLLCFPKFMTVFPIP